jgi:hypothetical protein
VLLEEQELFIFQSTSAFTMVFFVVLVLLKLNFLRSASLIIVSPFVLFVLVCVLLVFIRFTAASDLQTFLQIEIIL